MRLLYTATAYPPSIGGTQLLMHQLARQLGDRHSIQVVTQWDAQRTDWLLGTTLTGPRQPQAYTVDGVLVQRIAVPPAERRRLAPWVLAYYALQGPALCRIAAVLERELAPWAVDASLIHNARIGREGLSYASFNLARRRNVPFVLTPVHHPRWGGWLHRHYQRLYRQADALIALTESERQTLVGLGVDEARVAVTGMGPVLAESWDGERFRQKYGLGAEPIILFLGQKYAYKGLAALAAAAPLVWRHLPEVRFAFVGPRTNFSRRLFSTLRDHRFLELDAVSLQEKTDALAACAVLCVPSTQESFGGVYTEAWSLAKPVVAADIPALGEVIADGQDGLLIRPQAAAIAEAVSQLLEHPSLAAEMGRRGREKVEGRFSWPRLAAMTEAVYERVLQHGRP